jgi:hypothetical protein
MGQIMIMSAAPVQYFFFSLMPEEKGSEWPLKLFIL